MIYTARIEQTYDQPRRMKYIPETDSFIEKDCASLSYERNVRQPYGWLVESGTPPCEHLDVIVMTDKKYALGDTERVRIIGVFLRSDGDNKLVAVPLDRDIDDFSQLDDSEKEDMLRLYPGKFKGEGWFGREAAKQVINDFFSRKKRKIIITVQHTESLHHKNGMIGAWGDWELTEFGRKQAFEIGKWLLYEDCRNSFSMYTSDLKRAQQTAGEINKTLGITPIVTDVIREVNAGAGNGQSREWYNANKLPHTGGCDADYKPFPDAESDRELWERLLPFYREITANDMERILIVSHGTTLSFLQSMLMGRSLEDIGKFRFNGVGGSVSKFVIEPNGKTVAHYINQRVC